MQRLTTMKNSKMGEVWLYSSVHVRQWTCNFEGTVDGTTVKISKTGNTAEEALGETYAAWLRVTKNMPELLPMIAPPPSHDPDSQDGDQFVEPPTPVDEIPF